MSTRLEVLASLNETIRYLFSNLDRNTRPDPARSELLKLLLTSRNDLLKQEDPRTGAINRAYSELSRSILQLDADERQYIQIVEENRGVVYNSALCVSPLEKMKQHLEVSRNTVKLRKEALDSVLGVKLPPPTVPPPTVPPPTVPTTAPVFQESTETGLV